jgi:hypothetical protein
VDQIPDLEVVKQGADELHGHIALWKKKGFETKELEAGLRFCELRPGELIPRDRYVAGPGRGWTEKVSAATNASSAYDRHVSHRMADHRHLTIEAVRNGNRSRGRVLRYIDEHTRPDQAEWDIRTPPPLDIRRGDFRDVPADAQPESVALILTDPPYPEAYLPLWSDTAAFASRVLVPGGSLLAYTGQVHLPHVLVRLSEHPKYWWTLCLRHGPDSQWLPGRFVIVGCEPLVEFVRDVTSDRATSVVQRRTSRRHRPHRRRRAGQVLVCWDRAPLSAVGFAMIWNAVARESAIRDAGGL